MTRDDALLQIDGLVSVYEDMIRRSAYSDLGDLGSELAQLAVRLQAALDRLVPGPSAYGRDAEESRSLPDHVRVPELIGVISALRADIEAGWMRSTAELLHAETFADFTAMAEELNAKGYKDAAAVVAGAAFEHHLRLMCGKHGVAVETDLGKPKKADSMNSDLARVEVYNKLVQKQITSWLAIRNAAAHGDSGQFETADVARMVSGIEAFIANNPA